VQTSSRSEQRAENDTRTDDVDEERETLAGGPDGGQQLRHRLVDHAMTISTLASDATARSKILVDVLFSAVSSSFGPVWPEAMSARAFSTGFAYSTN
jgi:hypothetical protein